jgi:hypothetical protein
MTNRQISELTAATSLAGTDLMVVQQGINSRKATLNQMRALSGHGWGLYVDAATSLEASAIAVSSDTRTLLTIDGGAGSITSYVNGSGIVWQDNEHRNANVGDSYTIRVDFFAKKAGGSNAFFVVEQDISDGAGTFIVATDTAQLTKDTVNYRFSFGFVGYTLDTYATNGARFYLTSTENIQIWGKRIFIRKDYAAA